MLSRVEFFVKYTTWSAGLLNVVFKPAWKADAGL